MMEKKFVFGVVLALMIVQCGCSKSPSMTVKGQIHVAGIAPVDGTITLTNGQQSIIGQVQADGVFDMRIDPKQVLSPGEYKVLLNAPPVQTATDPTNGEIRAIGKVDDKLFPPKYRSFETSDASQTLVDGENKLKIELP